MVYEELTPGRRFRTGEATVSAEAIRAFAATYDPQPIHLDDGAAARGLFGRVIASGLQTLAASWRLWVDAGAFGPDALAGLGLTDLRWVRPVYPGDRISVEAVVRESRPSASHPGAGVVRVAFTVLNQRGEAVLTYTAAGLVRGRTLAAAPRDGSHR